MNDPRLEEIGAHLRAAAQRRVRRSRRRLTSAALALVVCAAAVVGAGVVARESGEAQAARVVANTYAATTRVPSGTKTMLHVVTQLEHEGDVGRMESWETADRFRRVGFHTDGSIHAEETLRRLPSGVYEYRAFHRESGGDVIRVARTTNPDAYDIDLIEPDEDLRAAVKRGELQFIGEALFEGRPTYELLLELDHPCGVILPDARILVERDSYRPVAVRLGPGLLRYLTIEEIPLDESRLRIGPHGGASVIKADPPARPASPCS
jgi:hypothetical protein